ADGRQRGGFALRQRAQPERRPWTEAERLGERPVDHGGRRPIGRSGVRRQVLAVHEAPGLRLGPAADRQQRRLDRIAAAEQDRAIGPDDGHGPDLGQPGDVGRHRRGVVDGQANRKALRGDDAHVVPGGVQHLAERDEQPAREEQHVEEQRPDDGDARHGERGPGRVGRHRPPRQGSGRHRPRSDRTLRRSSAQEAARPAPTPSGTAVAAACHAMRGVTRTNTSAVSYRHWKKRLITSWAPAATTRPKSAPASATSSPSKSTTAKIDRDRTPMRRSTPIASRRSSARITIRASRNAVLPTTVTMAIARWNRSMTTNGSSRRPEPSVASIRKPGSRRAISAATAGASCWFRSARLTAPTSSPEAGSRGSAVRRIRSGRWRRASSLRTENFRGSGTGSYEPTTRNRAARAPPASAASVTTSPTRTPASCISCRDRSTVGRSGGGGAALRLASALGGGPAGAAPAHRQRI